MAVRSSRGKLRIFTESFVAQCKVTRLENLVFRFPYSVRFQYSVTKSTVIETHI